MVIHIVSSSNFLSASASTYLVIVVLYIDYAATMQKDVAAGNTNHEYYATEFLDMN